MLATFIGSLQFVLEKGHDEDWFSSNIIIIFSVLAIFGLFFFLWRELTFRNPVVNLRVLKNGNLRIGTILSFIMGFGLYGSTFIIPLYTQSHSWMDGYTGGLVAGAGSIDHGIHDAVHG